MTKRIFRAVFSVALCVFFVTLSIIMVALYDNFSEDRKKQLKVQSYLAAQGVESLGLDYFSGLETDDFRITLVDGEGNVLFDSKSDGAAMENHLDREEIQEALETGYGESTRYSDTMLEKQYYAAVLLSDGSVLRLSDTQLTIWSLLLRMYSPILLVFVIAVVLSVLLSYTAAKQAVNPLNTLDFDHPEENAGYEELTPLFKRLLAQQAQLKRQEGELKRQRDEFAATVGSMKEGLVLVGEEGTILSVNRSAERILKSDCNLIGENVLSGGKFPVLKELLSRCKEGAVEQLVKEEPFEFEFRASPVLSDGKRIGFVILMFDVTEKEQAEQMRREFTANVSHELKTPLHSISGCAELLANGMVKREDVEQFAAQIYTESKRMIRLVEDIIKLSSLDEGIGESAGETFDLSELAEQAVHSLSQEAQRAGVEVRFEGERAELFGDASLAGLIVFNLLDNAVKYNRPGGTVRVGVKKEGTQVILRVADTGIGIPKEHQARIFERFYRVDKSRSKEVGGTGLGLSIVKHAAKNLGATVEVESEEGVGTTMTVCFAQGGNV